jgi:hypothetical protein
MPKKYPYTASAGPLLGTMDQLRKSFPATIAAETLQKLGLAPKNESYVINTLRFLGVIDEEGKKVERAARVFLEHNDEEFAKGIEGLVKRAYKDLFELHSDDAWSLDKGQLTTFFRTTDDSTDTVGQRQAGTFQTLAALAGHRELPSRKPRIAGKKKTRTPPQRTHARATKTAVKAAPEDGGLSGPRDNVGNSVGLTVRIEVNLPAVDDQSVYDKIFRSIRENLINAE